MQRVLSTHLIVNHRLTTVWLERIWNAGIPAVEIFCAKQHLDYWNKAQVSELGHWFRDSKLKLHSLHSPMHADDVWGKTGPNAVINLTEPSKPKRLTMIDEIKRALEIAEKVPFRYLIQHLGVTGEEWTEHKVEFAFSALEEVVLFARNRGVQVLLENIPNGLSSAERLVNFLDLTHLNVGFCLDTGHANLNEGVETACYIMGDRIRSIHVHDNDGKQDQHLHPLVAKEGTIDWRKVMGLLRNMNPEVPLLLELREMADHPNPIDSAVEVFDKLENLNV